jgi:hypothetical protein
MQPSRVAFVGAICVIIGWLVASTLSPPVARVQSRPQERAKAPEPVPELQFTEQLSPRLRQVAPVPVGRRNLFAFATQRTEQAPAAEQQVTLAPAADSTPLRTGPAYVLSGIGIAGDVRTAVLTTTGEDVRIVKVNDVVGEFTVAEISEQSVTLVRGDERFVLRFPRL